MADPSETRILAVEGNDSWRGILARELGAAGLEHEIVSDADTALERLGAEEFTGVITSGQAGDWYHIYESAQAAGAATVLLSGKPRTIALAQAEGIPSFYKGEFEVTKTLQEMVHAMLTGEAPSG